MANLVESNLNMLPYKNAWLPVHDLVQVSFFFVRGGVRGISNWLHSLLSKGAHHWQVVLSVIFDICAHALCYGAIHHHVTAQPGKLLSLAATSLHHNSATRYLCMRSPPEAVLPTACLPSSTKD